MLFIFFHTTRTQRHSEADQSARGNLSAGVNVMRKTVHYEERICDQCGKKETKPKSAVRFDPPAFSGWVHVSGGVKYEIGDTGSKDFCSTKCHVQFMFDKHGLGKEVESAVR